MTKNLKEKDCIPAGLAKSLVEWIDVDEHYNIVHFAVEHGLCKDDLFRYADMDEDFASNLAYAVSVMEYKVTDGALTGTLDRNVALRLLEQYAGWRNKKEIENTGQPMIVCLNEADVAERKELLDSRWDLLKGSRN